LNIISFIILVINIFCELFFFALIIRIILSWINISPYNPISKITYQITEPFLGKIRQYIKPLGMFDFTPMIAIILLEVLQRVAKSLLMYLSNLS
jgi:YggT family protein